MATVIRIKAHGLRKPVTLEKTDGNETTWVLSAVGCLPVQIEADDAGQAVLRAFHDAVLLRKDANHVKKPRKAAAAAAVSQPNPTNGAVATQATTERPAGETPKKAK